MTESPKLTTVNYEVNLWTERTKHRPASLLTQVICDSWSFINYPLTRRSSSGSSVNEIPLSSVLGPINVVQRLMGNLIHSR